MNHIQSDTHVWQDSPCFDVCVGNMIHHTILILPTFCSSSLWLHWAPIHHSEFCMSHSPRRVPCGAERGVVGEPLSECLKWRGLGQRGGGPFLFFQFLSCVLLWPSPVCFSTPGRRSHRTGSTCQTITPKYTACKTAPHVNYVGVHFLNFSTLGSRPEHLVGLRLWA